jgi:arginine/lysine/ornithine decarboxylase
MRWEALDENGDPRAHPHHPLVKDPEAWRAPRPFRVAVVEQCTYDGTIYSAEMILEAHRPSLRLHPVRRGLGRLHEVPSALCRPLRHGA